MTYRTAIYQLNANDAKHLKILMEQIASTSIEAFSTTYKKIAAKIVPDCDFKLTAVEFNLIVSVLDDFSVDGNYEQIRQNLIEQAPSLDSYSPVVMAISIVNEAAPDVDSSWLYDVHNDVMNDVISYSDSYRMTQGYIRGLIAARLVGIEAISDLDRSMSSCGGYDRLNK